LRGLSRGAVAGVWLASALLLGLAVEFFLRVAPVEQSGIFTGEAGFS